MSRIKFNYPHSDFTNVVGRPSPHFAARSIGEIVREAREYGVLPDLASAPCANDDDDPNNVDPYANARVDPMELAQIGIGEANVAVINANASSLNKITDVAPATEVVTSANAD